MNGSSLNDRFCTFDNLFHAWNKARQGKDKRQVSRFALDLENNLFQIEHELLNQTYRPGPYREFTINDRKPRTITAATFRDRVVHHALMRVCEPVFESLFHPASRACRVGKGTHAAVQDYQGYSRRYAYVLKMDIARYFGSIPRDLLLAKVATALKHDEIVWMFERLIATAPGAVGLPLGNLTSQVLGNLYLTELDGLITRKWGGQAYIRYVDDLIVLSDSKSQLWSIKNRVDAYLQNQGLHLHPAKVHLQPVTVPLHVLGYRVTPRGRRLRPDNGYRFRRRLRAAAAQCSSGKAMLADHVPSLNAWIGHARHGNTRALRRKIFAEVNFSSGLSPGDGAARRLVEQYNTERARGEPQQEQH